MYTHDSLSYENLTPASGAMLNCGVHSCPSKCHQLSDHSKMICYNIVDSTCPRGHRATQPCFQSGIICRYCVAEDETKEKRRQRDMKLEAERERRQSQYARELAELQEEIGHQRRLRREEYESQQRQKVIDQYRAELAKLKSGKEGSMNDISVNINGDEHRPGFNGSADRKNHHEHERNGDPGGKADKNGASEPAKSDAQADWDFQKQFEGAQSTEIDTLMGMIGLEGVKEKFLSIKAQVDTATRQNVDLKNERFGTVLVGNPGTGTSIWCYRMALCSLCQVKQPLRAYTPAFSHLSECFLVIPSRRPPDHDWQTMESRDARR